jgi:signal transduction histidine kinase
MHKVSLIEVSDFCLSPNLFAREPKPARIYQARFSVLLATCVAIFGLVRAILAVSHAQSLYFSLVFILSIAAMLAYRLVDRHELLSFLWILSLLTLEAVSNLLAPSHYISIFAWIPIGIGLTSYLAGARYGFVFTCIALLEAFLVLKFASLYAPLNEVVNTSAVLKGLQLNLLAAEIVGGISIYCFALLREQSEHELEQRRLGRSRSARKSAIRDMVGNLSHELNNPLAIVHGSIIQYHNELLKGPMPLEREHYFRQSIAESYARIEKVSASLRGFSNDSSDEFLVVKFSELYAQAQSHIDQKAKDYGFSIRSHSVDDGDALCCRPQQIIFVLTSILDNLCESLSETKSSVDILVEVTASLEVLNVQICSGGLSKGTELSFQPWVQDYEEPNSLQLDACQKIIIEHGGCLGVSREAKGTLYWFQLPRSPRIKV